MGEHAQHSVILYKRKGAVDTPKKSFKKFSSNSFILKMQVHTLHEIIRQAYFVTCFQLHRVRSCAGI